MEDESDVTDNLGGLVSAGGADPQGALLTEAEVTGRLDGAVLDTTVLGVCSVGKL